MEEFRSPEKRKRTEEELPAASQEKHPNELPNLQHSSDEDDYEGHHFFGLVSLEEENAAPEYNPGKLFWHWSIKSKMHFLKN